MLQNERARQCGRDGKYVMGCPGMLKIARLFISPVCHTETDNDDWLLYDNDLQCNLLTS